MLSVIIPVYNVEKYLDECLDSVINQSLMDLEIIIVNDGSTDNSSTIIEKFKQKDSRIKVINQKNHGLAAARNAGIEVATGKYITFLDSDDWIDLKMYQMMLEKMEKETADIVSCSVDDNYKNKNIPSLVLNDEVIKNIDVNRTLFFTNYLLKEGIVVWNKIYRSKIIKEKSIRFVGKEHILQEDIYFNFQYYFYVDTAVNISDILIHYRIRNSSITKSKIKDSFDKNLKLIEYMNQYVEYGQYDNQMNNYIAKMAYSLCNTATYHTEGDSISEIKTILIKSRHNKFYCNALPVKLQSLSIQGFGKYIIDTLIFCKAYNIAAVLQWIRVKAYKARSVKNKLIYECFEWLAL